MQRTIRIIRAFAGDRSGLTAIEYGAVLGAIALATGMAFQMAGDSIEAQFRKLTGQIEGAASGGTDDGADSRGGDGTSKRGDNK